jgi:polyhydroxyalkanoate synthesis regulator phasin
MLELLGKVVMTTIGVAAITRQKTEELVAEMKERFKLSEEEGKQLVDRIQTIANESREKISEMAEVEVKKAIERLGLVSRDEYYLLFKRVEELESHRNN